MQRDLVVGIFRSPGRPSGNSLDLSRSLRARHEAPSRSGNRGRRSVSPSTSGLEGRNWSTPARDRTTQRELPPRTDEFRGRGERRRPSRGSMSPARWRTPFAPLTGKKRAKSPTTRTTDWLLGPVGRRRTETAHRRTDRGGHRLDRQTLSSVREVTGSRTRRQRRRQGTRPGVLVRVLPDVKCPVASPATPEAVPRIGFKIRASSERFEKERGQFCSATGPIGLCRHKYFMRINTAEQHGRRLIN